MSRLEEAVQRLEAAIGRLDRALAAGGESGGADIAALRHELEAIQRRNREVEAVADQVARRLDQAVGRVTAILES